MTNAMTLFGGEGNALVSSDLFKSLMDMNKTLAGSGSGVPRISIKGGRFREIIGGEQVRVFKGDQLNVVVVNAAPIGRTYFEGTYDPNVAAPPVCWSSDTKVPNADVPEDQRMSSSCANCPMNVKGSGAGESRACRFSQRLAVTVEGDTENTVYQMQLPATSIFGEAKAGNMGMQAYAKLLAAHNTPAIAVVTGISFDEDAEVPRLYFKPVRPLTEEELQAAVEAKDSEAAKAAITMTVSQVDGVKSGGSQSYNPKKQAIAIDDEEEAPKPKAKPKVEEEEAPKPKAKAKPKVEEEEGEEEPAKRPSKAAAAAPAAKADLASIIGQWDDDED
jgi:hypothetical protein